MIEKKKVSAIFLTRESERIINKNFKMLYGRPLYRFVLDAAINSLYIDNIFISTSIDKHKTQIINYFPGVDIIDRPEELSTPETNSISCIQHAAQFIDSDYIVHLDFTKPFTKTETIDFCIKNQHDKKLDSCFTVKTIDLNFVNESAAVCSQLKPWQEKKNIYFGACRVRTKKLCLEMDVNSWGTGEKHEDIPCVRPWEIDIDNEWDFIFAEALMEKGYLWK